MVLTKKAEWRFTITEDGEQFVMMVGISMMLVLSAGSLVFLMPRLLIRVAVLTMELDRFGWMMFNVGVMNHHCLHADMTGGEITTVATVKTLVSSVVHKVRIIYENILNPFKKQLLLNLGKFQDVTTVKLNITISFIQFSKGQSSISPSRTSNVQGNFVTLLNPNIL
jgi:hypothetical protein